MTQRVTQAEFARIANVNRSTVTRWIRNGRISLGPDGRIDVARAMREREATESPMPHHQARKAQIDEQKAAHVAQGGNGAAPGGNGYGITADSPVTEISGGLKYQTYLLQKAKAEKAALEVDQMAGALVERAEVDFVLEDLGQVLRALLESRADRLAGPLASHRGDVNAIHAALEEDAHELLVELSAHMARRVEQIHAEARTDG